MPDNAPSAIARHLNRPGVETPRRTSSPVSWFRRQLSGDSGWFDSRALDPAVCEVFQGGGQIATPLGLMVATAGVA